MFYTFIANSFFENQKTAVGKNLMRPDDQMDMILLTVGCLILAYAFSTLYSKWARAQMGKNRLVSFWIPIDSQRLVVHCVFWI